ncbi:MAG: flavin reductase [Acutalibacteraceae bacterium]
MKKINISDFDGNVFTLLKDNWALLTAGNKDSFNTMTVSWGAMGELWNKDVCFCFVRPQRYTYEFTEREEYFTLSFFSKEYKKALSFCGSHSGRDVDKVKQTGLTPVSLGESIAFSEAEYVFLCKKIAFQDMKPDGILEKEIDGKCYPEKDYHRTYVGEIIGCYKK